MSRGAEGPARLAADDAPGGGADDAPGRAAEAGAHRVGSPQDDTIEAVAAGARPPVALYVHVPFCVSVCPYCDFVVYPGVAATGRDGRAGRFLDALLTEIGLRADAIDAAFGPLPDPARRPGDGRQPLASVYLGGGTPSLLPAAAIASILDTVRSRFGLVTDAEVTLEANPGPTERGDAEALRAAGITRLSVGAQSLQTAELRRLGRRHTPSDVADTVRSARHAGIPSISIDLLYDVPGQSLDAWIDSLKASLELEPDHLSLYALTLDDPEAEGLAGPTGDHLPTRAGARRWRIRARAKQDEDRAAAQYHCAASRLRELGWRGYEISNWARPGHESRHNLAYWSRLPYEGVGPGAHAFDGVTRRWNAASLAAYLEALDPPRTPGVAPRVPPGGFERIDADTAAAEAIILGLRTDRGIDAAALESPRFGPHLAWAVANGLARPGSGRRIRLTDRGRLLSNEVFARLV